MTLCNPKVKRYREGEEHPKVFKCDSCDSNPKPKPGVSHHPLSRIMDDLGSLAPTQKIYCPPKISPIGCSGNALKKMVEFSFLRSKLALNFETDVFLSRKLVKRRCSEGFGALNGNIWLNNFSTTPPRKRQMFSRHKIFKVEFAQNISH